MGRQIPFIKAIMLNSWRQRTWKNLFLFFIHIYNIYFEYQRKTTLTNQKEKIMFFMHHQVIRISFFVHKTKDKDMLRSNEVWNQFIVFVYRKQRTQAKCFFFSIQPFTMYMYTEERRSNCLISLLLSIHCDVTSENKTFVVNLIQIRF